MSQHGRYTTKRSAGDLHVMTDVIRPDKDAARKLVVEFAPQYAELLRDLQRADKWLRLPEKLVLIRNRLNIHGYVELYNDERNLNVALALGLLGEEGIREFDVEFSQFTPEEQCAVLNGFIECKDELDFDEMFSPTEEQQRQAMQT